MLNLYMILVFRIFYIYGRKRPRFYNAIVYSKLLCIYFLCCFILGINIIRPWLML